MADEAIFKAAEQGYAKAQYVVGFKYHFGQGVPNDYKEAFKWYSRAAEQGHVDAQYNLGFMNFLGQGTPQNFIMAYMWMSIAKANGYLDEGEVLEIVKSKLTSTKIASAEKLVKRCIESDYKDCG